MPSLLYLSLYPSPGKHFTNEQIAAFGNWTVEDIARRFRRAESRGSFDVHLEPLDAVAGEVSAEPNRGWLTISFTPAQIPNFDAGPILSHLVAGANAGAHCGVLTDGSPAEDRLVAIDGSFHWDLRADMAGRVLTLKEIVAIYSLTENELPAPDGSKIRAEGLLGPFSYQVLRR